MTREEAIAILIREKDEDLFVRTEYRERIHEALNMGIKALEQEHCEDAISRKDLIEFLEKVTVTDGITFETGINQILTEIRIMPSAHPIRSKWEWISYHFGAFYVCSCCNERNNRRDKFCPNCGADMRETDEEL